MATLSTTPEHSNWLTVGEALRISKSVLEPYIQQVVNDWHKKLLTRLKKKGGCRTPSHCNPSDPGSLCSSCDAWCKELCKHHKGDTNRISWSNTDCRKWAKQEGAWEVAKVFMASLGQMKSKVINAKSTDIAGLLNILRFFPDEAFPRKPLERPNRSSIEKVSQEARNPWAHSAQQEMKSGEKTKAIDSLKQLLGDQALKKSVGNALKDLQDLENDGIKNISLAESVCLEILARELPADMAKLKDEIDVLTETSNSQEHEILQMKSKFSGICSSVEYVKKMSAKLKESNSEMQEQLNNLLATLEKDSDLKNELQVKLTKLEEKQSRLESRQDVVEQKLEEISEQVNLKNQEIKKMSLQSCLPEFQDKVFGRERDIDHITTLIQHDKESCVVLTGAPGFGKTTVAINMAHGLKQANKVVIFVSLREMRSAKDICSALLAQVGQHPKEKEMEELIQWARSLEEEVLLILDNAEDALQSEKDAFCGLLEKLQNTNSKFLQFLITSRERFSLPTMEVTCREIKELSEEQGIDVIRSMVSESGENSGDSEAFIELANLCDGIPLALRMIGSLLNDVDIASLVEELKSFPMEVLENTALPDYHQSIRWTFECSFKRLDCSLQAKLVRLSVFRGSFSQKAASALFQENRLVKTVQILNKLTDKSLLSKLDSKRYEMHSLIQKYLINVKKEQYISDFDAARDTFIDYYVSLTEEGHKMFWSKDKFKPSIELFRNDNVNIEIALEMCYKEPEKMQTFFPIVWSISMYLEMCISMEKLTKFLESCCESAANRKKKGTEMEAQCFLGYYEWKRAGNSEKYKTHINNAKQLYEKEKENLSQSQKWLYKHSYGMFLDQQNIANDALKVTEEALQIAENSSASRTDLSLTLNQLGILEKRSKNYDKAESWFKKSYDKRKKQLGADHILSIPKHLADLYLQKGRNEEALELYEKALDAYKANNMDNEKQCIYLLKNMGSCCFNLGKVEKSLEYFYKAKDLSERRLEGDQIVKVQIYSEMAKVFYSTEDVKPRALEYAQKAIEMAERLQRSWFGKPLMEAIVKELA